MDKHYLEDKRNAETEIAQRFEKALLAHGQRKGEQTSRRQEPQGGNQEQKEKEKPASDDARIFHAGKYRKENDSL